MQVKRDAGRKPQPSAFCHCGNSPSAEHYFTLAPLLLNKLIFQIERILSTEWSFSS